MASGHPTPGRFDNMASLRIGVDISARDPSCYQTQPTNPRLRSLALLKCGAPMVAFGCLRLHPRVLPCTWRTGSPAGLAATQPSTNVLLAKLAGPHRRGTGGRCPRPCHTGGGDPAGKGAGPAAVALQPGEAGRSGGSPGVRLTFHRDGGEVVAQRVEAQRVEACTPELADTELAIPF